MQKKNYINNKELFQIMSDWKQSLETDPETRMPEYLGEAILKIAYGLQNHYKFVNYTSIWKEAMVGEAIINCVKYIKNFNPEKSNNPYGYITQCCYHSFQNSIPKEQEQEAIKWRSLTNISSEFSEEEYQMYIEQEFFDDINNKIQNFDEKVKKKKEKIKANNNKAKEKQQKDIDDGLIGLEKFYD